MINIQIKSQCCGCGACKQMCPKHCISLCEDEEGFLYPIANKSTCIDCGLCERVCPILNPYNERRPILVLAAINNNIKVRKESSSGGIFTLLAEKVINEDGVVFGARFDDEWQVTLDYTESIEGLAHFRGSKYVQARTGETYRQCEQFLKDGRKVLYTGTPCQIAGLHHFLRKEYDNLITCDLICHGAPSPKVWSVYLNQFIGNSSKLITNIEFRNKDQGWKTFNFKMSYDEGGIKKTISTCHKDNLFMRAFLSDIILRPSCYNCRAKQGISKSDITIADFWGIQNSHPDMDDDMGTGLVIFNTIKGRCILDLSRIRFVECNLGEAVLCNNGIKPLTPIHPKRNFFFEHLSETENLEKLIKACTKPTLKQRLKSYMSLPKRIFMKLRKLCIAR